MRKKNFDLFILIFPPLVGITFSVLFSSYLYLLLPSLVLGWFLPEYVGYWRGSIKLDSDAERFRSIPYLWIGILSYVFFAILVMIVKPLAIEAPFDEIILFAMIFLGGPFLVWKKIRTGLEELIDDQPEENFREILNGSWIAAECLAFSLYGFISVTYLLLRYRGITFESISGIIVIIVFLIGSIVLLWKFFDKESEARELSKTMEEPEEIKKE